MSLGFLNSFARGVRPKKKSKVTVPWSLDATATVKGGNGRQYSFIAIMLACDPDNSASMKYWMSFLWNIRISWIMNESNDWTIKNNKVMFVPSTSTFRPQLVCHWLLDKDKRYAPCHEIVLWTRWKHHEEREYWGKTLSLVIAVSSSITITSAFLLLLPDEVI